MVRKLGLAFQLGSRIESIQCFSELGIAQGHRLFEVPLRDRLSYFTGLEGKVGARFRSSD